MNDRIPLYPGRVKMTPVAGQANTFDLVRADDPTQAGTPLNKATLLKDATAALFGMGSSAVPDDILAAIGKYKQYWWRRRSLAYKEVRTPVTTKVFIDHNYGRTLKIANSISINQDTAEIALDNPENFTIDTYSTTNDFRDRLQELLDKAPCYMTGLESDETAIYYLPAGGTLSYSTQDTVGSYTICFYYSNKTTNRIWLGTTSDVKAQVVSSVAGVGPWQYIQSSNRSAYPDSGTQDGYEYEYLGIPLDNAVTASKIATGSYVGTGTYGINNPNSLKFDFEPKIVLIKPSTNGTLSKYWMCFTNGLGTSGGGLVWGSESYTLGYKVSYSFYGNTVQWYTTDARSTPQANDAATTYGYIAIG